MLSQSEGVLLHPKSKIESYAAIDRDSHAGLPAVRVMLFASHLVVYFKGQEVARHERLIRPCTRLRDS